MTELDESRRLLEVALEAADAVGDQLRSAFRSDMRIDFKRDARDLVTVHDKASERVIAEVIMHRVPDSQLLGEEGGSVGSGRVTWYVDPIDGTSNFAVGIAFWCVSIAAEVDGKVVAGVISDPISGDVFSADLAGSYLNGEPLASVGAASEQDATIVIGYPNARQLAAHGEAAMHDLAELIAAFRAVRRTGSAALSLMQVAAGWADAAAGFSVNAWDVSAASFIITQAGGQYIPLAVGHDELADLPYHNRGYIALAGDAQYPTLRAVSERVAARD